MSEVVPTLEQATIGSSVWLYDMDANHYENGEYKGRGAYKVAQIEAETRKSFTAFGMKFDRKTGGQIGLGGYSPRKSIMGETERVRKDFISKHRHEITRHVQYCNDADALRKVAEAIAYNLGEKP